MAEDTPPVNAGFLEARWWTGGDGTGRLTVTAVSATGFAGHSAAWFDGATVRAFAEGLKGFPLADESRPRLTSGSKPIGGEWVVQVGLAVYPVGRRGQVAIGVQLATEVWTSPPMRAGEHECVRLELLTTYERLRYFADDLQAVVQERRDQARIKGEDLRR